MAEIIVNIQMDETLKHKFETVCSEMGMSMTTVFTAFAKVVSSRKEIPFMISSQLKPDEITLASENALAKEWLLPDEDEAWANL
ncbi:MAG: type II toxin-antitoxin system RelB/DinJ family antitoxin [Deltaproteobacteria bacterium]|jgi:addiction module RelB/DinJ family antitoxin|nr:type II toxin-antitoxin system RelB/DinJ family antitoxin [Deltaproteobacteria bacterium]